MEPQRLEWCTTCMRMVGGLVCLALTGGLAAAGSAAADPYADLRRPLALPRLEAGAPCPASSRQTVSRGIAPALGPGPVYPVGFDEESAMAFEYPPSRGSVFRGTGWGGAKTLWVARPGYEGRILIRGKQLDGPDDVAFSLSTGALARELAFAAGETRAWSEGMEGWRQFPSSTRLRASGCYAFQVDGETFSTVVVFRAKRVQPFDSTSSVRTCTGAWPTMLVNKFVRAFNGGATAQLDRLFAPERAFKWYSAPKLGAVRRAVYRRATLVAYLERRQALGERLQLVRLVNNGFANGYFHLVFQVRRSLPRSPTVVHQGKGAAVCSKAGAHLAVWSIGGPVGS